MRFEDSAKATNSIQKEVNTISSGFIVKREAVMNRTGQIVGQLLVLQDSKRGGKPSNVEEVVFTQGVYSYHLISRNLGAAQRIQKLFPLERPIGSR